MTNITNICRADNCWDDVFAHGLCEKHWKKWCDERDRLATQKREE